MLVEHKKRGMRIRLTAMPTQIELATLNELAGFNAYTINTQRKDVRLLCKTSDNVMAITMECPINQYFYI